MNILKSTSNTPRQQRTPQHAKQKFPKACDCNNKLWTLFGKSRKVCVCSHELSVFFSLGVQILVSERWYPDLWEFIFGEICVYSIHFNQYHQIVCTVRSAKNAQSIVLWATLILTYSRVYCSLALYLYGVWL